MKQKLTRMLELQDSLNRHINPDWINAGYEWYRAIWIECAELMDHFGWKWWKSQAHDMEQIRLELIDIWHFGLSAELLRHNGSIESAADTMLAELAANSENPEQAADFKAGVDALARHALVEKILYVPVFLMLLADVDTTFDDLYRIYVGKNVLNRFRQNNGYKDGTYLKQWQGREDNEHLSEIVKQLNSDSADFEDNIYEELGRHYPG